MSNEREYNTSRYKYNGPTMEVEIIKPKGKYKGMRECLLLPKGNEVKAEVNINVATITDYLCGEWYKLVKPVDIAAKYLEPVKPEPIHFDPKDDVDVRHFFGYLYSEAAKIQSKFGNIFNENFAQEPSNGPLDNVKKWAREHHQDLLNNETKEKVWEQINNDNIEVGGGHYQTAIQPWDFIYANGLDFDSGNIVKYACRHQKKGGAEDVKKIISYAKHILKTQYGIDYGTDND